MAEENIMDTLLQGGDDYLIDPIDNGEPQYSGNNEPRNDVRGSAGRIMQSNKQPVQSDLSPKIQEIMKQNKALQDKLNSFETKFGDIESKTKELESTQTAATYKALTEDILRQEEELLKDPLHSQFYDREKIRPQMYAYWKGNPEKGIEGKNLTPFEVNAIVNYPAVAAELMAFRNKFKEINASRNMQFTSESNANVPIDEIANVRNSPKGSKADAARKLAMERADRLL